MTSISLTTSWGGGGLLGVELDDELLAHRDVDLGTCGKVSHGDLKAALAGFEPGRRRTVEGVEVVAHDDHRLGLVAQRDDVAFAHGVTRDGDALAVDGDMAVAHELARLRPARSPTRAEHDVVEAQLEQLEQILAGHALATVRLLVDAAELLLHQAVDAARLLLLAQLQQVLGALALPVSAGFTRRVGPALDR